MYLSTFRKHGVGPGNWGTAAWWGHMASRFHSGLNSDPRSNP